MAEPAPLAPTAPLRTLFVNENIGGHATMHLHLRRALDTHPSLDASIVDIPAPRLARRIVAARIPGLDRLDVDLQPLRDQLALSALVRRQVLRRGGRFDVLHVYTHNAALLSVDALERWPSVISLDGTNEQNAYTLPSRPPGRFTPATLRLTRRFEERVYENATLLVAQSAWAAASLERDYGVDPERIRIVPFGISIPPWREPTPTDRPEITFVGGSMERKGGMRLLELFRRHLADRATLNLVTRDPVAPEAGVRVFNGVTPGDGTIERLLARTAVFAFPSEIDKSSYAVLEAMGAGVPVVAFDVAAIPEQVEHDVTGLLIPAGDDEAFLGAIVDLLDDESTRRRLGRAGRARLEARYDATKTTGTLIDALRLAVERFSAG